MAAFNFPNNPSDGDTHTENGLTYVWDATNGAWKRSPASLSKGEKGEPSTTKGDKGDDGRHVSRVYIEEGKLHISYNDGEVQEAGKVVGPRGGQGSPGDKGDIGPIGETGPQGPKGCLLYTSDAADE